MLTLYRRALRIPDRAHRRSILLVVPASLVVAMVEAEGFGPLYALLQSIAGGDGESPDGMVGDLVGFIGIDDDESALWTIGVVIFVLLLVKGVASITLLYWQSTVLARAEAATSEELFDAYLHAPHEFHLKVNSAELIRNTQASVSTVYQSVLLGLVTVVIESAVVAAVAVVLIVADPLVALLTAVLLSFAAVGYTHGLGRFSREIGRVNQEMVKDIQQKLYEGLGGVKIYQVLNRQSDVSDDYAESRSEWADTKRSIVFVNQLPRYYLELVLLVGVAIVGLAAATMKDGAEAAASVGLLLAAALRLMPSLNKILAALNRSQVGRHATNEVHHEMKMVEDLKQARVAAQSARPLDFHREIALRDVAYTYEGTRTPALHDINFSIKKGESIGVVGSSGAGKSTLVDVLLGLLWPQQGQIEIDEVRLQPELVASWRKLVGYVPQDIFIADTTLRRNVALGVPEADIDDQAVHRAVQMANLDTFVSTLPDGLETRMGERGVRFSGGQRQRVGIARALYPGPSVLLLDEATSALDSRTEEAITGTIRSLRGHVTMVVIAHRLSTVRDCDRLVLLDAGKVIGVGDFDALRRTNGHFAEMVRAGSTS